MYTLLLGIYIALIFIRPMDWWQPVLDWELVNVTAITLLVVVFPRILEEAPRLWKSHIPIKMGAAFILATCLSWVPSFWIGGIQFAFQEIGKLYVLFFLVVLLGRSAHGYRVILWTIIACTIWLAIHAILQIHQGHGFGGQAPMWRVTNRQTGEGVWQAMAFGIFEDPNDVCLQFILVIPLLFAEFRSSSARLIQGLSLLGIPVVAYGAWLTNSRGGYVGIFAMVVAYLVSHTKGIKRWFLLAFSLFFLAVFAPSRFSAGLIGQQDRSVLWGDGIGMFKNHPLLGVGYRNFSAESSESKVAHNSYVEVLAEIGIIGYIPFFLFIYFSMLYLRRAINLGPLLTSKDRWQLTGLFSAGVGYLTSLYFLTRHRNHVFWILLALFIVKAANACRTPESFAEVFRVSPADYRRSLYWAFGSIIFMWITIRIVNSAR
jgi:hypothetical protein